MLERVFRLWTSHAWQFRVRFALELEDGDAASGDAFWWMKGTNGKVTCDRGIAGEGEDDQ